MDVMGKRLLILGANPETAGIVKKAKDMGITTYVTDNNAAAYAKRYADIPYNIDATDVGELEKLIKKEHIDGILCGVAESLMPAYATICKDFNLPCYGNKELFSLFTNKSNFKDACREYDVPVVEEFFLNNYSDDELKKVKFPVVVKPVDACSSKGISVCRTLDELKDGISKALQFSNSKELIIEKYMTGEEVIVYYAFQDGEPSLVAMCDRYTNKEQKGVAQLPTAYIYPSRHLRDYTANTNERVKQMFRSLGVKNGFMFIQSFIDDKGEIRFYEPGYRLNGAQEHYIVSETTGIDAKECLINLALTGMEAEFKISELADPHMKGKYGCKLSPLIRCGTIKSIIGLDIIAKLKNVISINPSYDEGDSVTGYGTLKQISCRFFIVANSKQELKNTIDEIYSHFDVIDENGESLIMKTFNSEEVLKYE